MPPFNVHRINCSCFRTRVLLLSIMFLGGRFVTSCISSNVGLSVLCLFDFWIHASSYEGNGSYDVCKDCVKKHSEVCGEGSDNTPMMKRRRRRRQRASWSPMSRRSKTLMRRRRRERRRTPPGRFRRFLARSGQHAERVRGLS